MIAYYNEIDRFCCDWLQNLMDAGLITPGKIDDRSIADVSPDDVRGYERCHFFAGIAGWELALSLSGYAGPVWTGSCPCQPFSAAGKGKASGDERHLWPIWFELIKAVRPAVIFGEQVEAAIGWGWLDLIHSDMEPEGYTIRSAVLPACSVGAPHIRQRLWFVAYSDAPGRSEHRGSKLLDGKRPTQWDNANGCGCADSIVGHADSARRQRRIRLRGNDGAEIGQAASQAALQASPWDNLIWLPCTDGKQRPTHPGIFPLAHGVSARVAKLRAAGNAIVPQVAAEFIKASMT